MPIAIHTSSRIHVSLGKRGHEPAANQDAENRNERNERRLERADHVRAAASQHDHTAAHDHEREQRTDRHELAEQSNRKKSGDDRGDRFP